MSKLSKIFIESNTSIKETIKVIEESGFQIALVVKDKKLIGTITDGDIRRGMLKGFSLDSSAKNIMKNGFAYAEENTAKSEMIAMIKSKKIRHIPILNKKKEVIDLFTIDDLINSQSVDNKVIIMAGGEGKRLMPLTENCPKPMIKINQKPILEIIIENLKKVGFYNIVISVNYLKEQIIDYFKNGEEYGVKISYIEESRPLGTAGSLSLRKFDKENPILVINGDVITNIDYIKLLEFHRNENSEVTIGIRQHSTIIPFGVVETSGLDVKSIIEKPIITKNVNAAIYLFNSDILNLLEPNLHQDMPEFLITLIDRKIKVMAFPIHENWVDIGLPESLNSINHVSK